MTMIGLLLYGVGRMLVLLVQLAICAVGVLLTLAVAAWLLDARLGVR